MLFPLQNDQKSHINGQGLLCKYEQGSGGNQHMPESILPLQSLRGQFQESIQDEMKAKESKEEDKPVTPIGALW